MKAKKLALSFLFLLTLSLISNVLLVSEVSGQSTLSLTIETNKQTTYDKYDPITISGTVQYGDSSPANVLVGIQVNYPTTTGSPAQTMVLRTVLIGSGTPSNEYEQVTSAYPTNGLGGSKINTVENGDTAYFTASVSDIDDQFHSALLVFSLYDGNGVPIALDCTNVSIGPDATQSCDVGIGIPTSAHSGTAYGYVDVFSNYPQNNGIPMAQEEAFQFTISGGTPSSGPAPTSSGATAGAYSLTFKLPKDNTLCPDGGYEVYASVYYGGQLATANTGFNVLLIGDFDFAGVVNGNDLFIFAGAYINYYAGQSYNTLCDINGDGKVDSTDFFLFIAAYIQYWSP